MPKWIDYKQLKAEISFADVLEYYSVQTKIKGEQAKGMCPLPEHENNGKSQSLSVNLGRNIFQCFGCGAKGNVLDFIAMMEHLDPQDPKAFQKAAVLAKRKFLYTPQREVSSLSKRSKPKQGSQPRIIVNPPLDFELQGLDPDHPWFEEHGFKPETVRYFGAGYCKRGFMKGRIAIPLHDHEGQLIGYAGRLVDESKISDEMPKYLFPARRERKNVVYDFQQGLFLYNGHKIKNPVDDLFVVQGFTAVWRLWQAGTRDVVSVMDGSLSDEQAGLLFCLTTKNHGCVWVLPDADDNGFVGEVFQKAGEDRYCRWKLLSNFGLSFGYLLL